jgi:predicted dehydrogenase
LQDGGYEYHAVADYFPAVASAEGSKLGVPAERCFSGLSGYKRVIESGVEAMVILDVPYFYPEQAKDAVAAGLHVYMAKPVAVDVPGALSIGELGKTATQRQRVFLVDYQMPTDAVNIEIRKRIREGGLGELAYVNTFGQGHGFSDPPKGKTIENRLRNLTWVNDIALGGDYIGNFDIHALDAALWVLGRLPVAASGRSRICRRDPHGDSEDVTQVVYEYADGLLHTHVGQALPNEIDNALTAKFYGRDAYAEMVYWGRSILRGGGKAHAGNVENLYEQGARSNIATFHDLIEHGRFENETAERAKDGTLLCILGRESAARKSRLTMDDLIKENKKLEVDLAGLKS